MSTPQCSDRYGDRDQIAILPGIDPAIDPGIDPGFDLVAARRAIACFADADRTSVHHVAIHLAHGVLRVATFGEFDEAEAARATGFTVKNDVDVANRVAAGLESLAESVGCRVPGKVTDEESCAHQSVKSSDSNGPVDSLIARCECGLGEGRGLRREGRQRRLMRDERCGQESSAPEARVVPSRCPLVRVRVRRNEVRGRCGPPCATNRRRRSAEAQARP